jgi:hypothetical protein
MEGLALVCAVWAAGYAIACAVWPYASCRKCHGAGKFRSPSGKYWRPYPGATARAAYPHRPLRRRVVSLGQPAGVAARAQQQQEGRTPNGLGGGPHCLRLGGRGQGAVDLMFLRER